MLDHSERRNSHIAVLLLILISAAALRIYHLGSNSLWEDEYFSVECSSGWGRTDMHLKPSQVVPDLISLRNARPVWSIWSSIARDENHPPLYFILLRFWREMFGDSAVALRSLSVVGSLLGIAFLYFVGEVAIGPGVALWACAMMAVAWPQIQEAQEARVYALVTADALLCLLALVRIRRFGVTGFRIVWLFTTALALPLMHYLSATTLLAMVVYAAIGLRGPTRRGVLGCFAAVFVAYAILWGPQLLGQRHIIATGTSWLIDTSKHPLLETMESLAGICVRFLVEPRIGKMAAVAGGVAALIVPPVLFRRIPQLLLWWLWLVFPIAAVLLIDLFFHRRSLGLVKYTLAAAPALYVMIGMLAVSRIWSGAWVRGAVASIPALAILCCLLCLPDVYTTDMPDWREFARFVRSASAPSQPIVFVGRDLQVDGFSALGLSYNLAGSGSPFIILDDYPTPRFFASLNGARQVCLIGGEDLSSIRLPAGAKMVHAEGFPLLGIAWKVTLPQVISQAN